MKKMKKIMALFLAMAMALGMSVTTFATNTPSTVTNGVEGKVTDRGTIKVTGIQKENGTSFGVYAIQVVKAKYGANGYFASDYEALFDNLTITNKQLVQTDLSAQLGTIKSNIAHNTTNNTWTGTAGNNATPTKDSEKNAYGDYFDVVPMTYNETDQSYSASVAVGSYLIYVEGAEAKFYSPIIVSASYVAANDGNSAIESGNLNIANGEAKVKVSTTPNFSKEAAVPERNSNDTNTDAASVNIGEDVTYTVTVNPVPDYDGANPIFHVTDTLSDGLDIIYNGRTEEQFKSSIVVKAGAADAQPANYTTVPAEKYTVTVDSSNKRKFTVNFVSGTTYGLEGYENQILTITYTAKVNANAKMNSDANTNDAKLTYSKDSNIVNNSTDIPAKTYNYTFDLSADVNGNQTTSMVNKVGKETLTSTESVALPGAEFTLYTDASCSNDKVYSTNPNIPNGVVVSGAGESGGPAKGALVIRGLAAGTYFLKETKAPAGYSLNTDVYKIEIDAAYYEENDTDIPEGKTVGQLKSWTVKVTNTNDNTDQGKTATFGGGSTNTTINVQIPNTHLTALPSTGGIGTTIFTIGGCAIMILAAALYFATRRKTAK